MPIFASLVVVDEARRNHLIRGSPVDVSYLERLITRGVLQLREPAPDLVLAVARVIEFKDAPIVAAAITAEASMFASYDRKHLLSRADDIRRLFDIAVMAPEKIVRSMPSTDPIQRSTRHQTSYPSCMADIAIRTVTAIRYVAPLREGGSLPGVMEADDLGTYVVKFRGAAQGVKTLVAELLTGEIGRLLGLPVPEIVLVELDPVLGAAEPDPDIQDLLKASPGLNFGLDFLPGSLPYSVAMRRLVEPERAARVVWLDALTTNIDRTPRNPNLLIWHKRLWLIDHGASLYVHHSWEDVEARARTAFTPIVDHVLLPVAGPIPAAGAVCRPLVTRDAVEQIVAAIPDDWLADAAPFSDAGALRTAYVELVMTRLSVADAFEAEAERARLRVAS